MLGLVSFVDVLLLNYLFLWNQESGKLSHATVNIGAACINHGKVLLNPWLLLLGVTKDAEAVVRLREHVSLQPIASPQLCGPASLRHATKTSVGDFKLLTIILGVDVK